jgi:hypothetical protein
MRLYGVMWEPSLHIGQESAFNVITTFLLGSGTRVVLAGLGASVHPPSKRPKFHTETFFEVRHEHQVTASENSARTSCLFDAEDYIEISLDSEYCYNPLHNDLDAYALAYNIASLLNNLFGRGKEPFWQQAYTNLVKFIILLHKAAFNMQARNMWPRWKNTA